MGGFERGEDWELEGLAEGAWGEEEKEEDEGFGVILFYFMALLLGCMKLRNIWDISSSSEELLN